MTTKVRKKFWSLYLFGKKEFPKICQTLSLIRFRQDVQFLDISKMNFTIIFIITLYLTIRTRSIRQIRTIHAIRTIRTIMAIMTIRTIRTTRTIGTTHTIQTIRTICTIRYIVTIRTIPTIRTFYTILILILHYSTGNSSNGWKTFRINLLI